MTLSPQIKAKVEGYQSTTQAKQLAAETPLLLVAGPAGSGKDSIIQHLLSSGDYEHLISHTTRNPRANEKNSQDYYFIDWPTAEKMIDEQRFLEVALVYDDYLFGTSTAELRRIKDSGKIGLTDIDVEGAKVYYQLNKELKAVFILPPSYDEWLSRLNQRNSGENQEDIKRRLEDAQSWLERALADGYWHFVINTDLAKAVDDTAKYAKLSTHNREDDDTLVEHAWHVLGELKQQLNS